MRALECKKCGRWVENIGDETKSVTCSYCTMLVVGLPEETKGYVSTGRPPGWHWMSEFVDKDGNVFHKGKEQPKLKGTLPVTKVKPRKKSTKRRTKQQVLVDRHKAKKAALKKAVKKQQDFINHTINKG
jgi:hypothetical protein